MKKGADNCWEKEVDKKEGPFVDTGFNSLEWRSDIRAPVLSVLDWSLFSINNKRGESTMKTTKCGDGNLDSKYSFCLQLWQWQQDMKLMLRRWKHLQRT